MSKLPRDGDDRDFEQQLNGDEYSTMDAPVPVPVLTVTQEVGTEINLSWVYHV